MEESIEKPINEGTLRAKAIEKRNLAILAFFILVSLVFLSFRVTMSVFLGGLITVVNFRVLWKAVEGLLHRKDVSKGLLYAGVFMKFFLLIGLIGLIVMKLPIHVGAFLVGLSSISIAVISEGFYARI